MKYPCITRNDNEIEMILFNEDTAIILNGIHKGELHDVYPRFRSRYTNITREYLANTWGVVESKEHAEFIIELAVLHGLEAFNEFDYGITHFAINKGEVIFTYGAPSVSEHDKQITIPLPPKAELPEAGHNLVFSPVQDFKAARNITKEFRKEMNCSDELLSKEWPCVGDEVCWSNGHRKGELKCIHDSWAWVKVDDDDFASIRADKLKKPKTPEEALRDDLASLVGKSMIDNKTNGDIANILLTKYNITPKED